MIILFQEKARELLRKYDEYFNLTIDQTKFWISLAGKLAVDDFEFFLSRVPHFSVAMLLMKESLELHLKNEIVSGLFILACFI